MLLRIEWYWWLVIVVVLSIPFKIKFVKWFSKRQQEQKDNHKDKWSDDE